MTSVNVRTEVFKKMNEEDFKIMLDILILATKLIPIPEYNRCGVNKFAFYFFYYLLLPY